MRIMGILLLPSLSHPFLPKASLVTPGHIPTTHMNYLDVYRNIIQLMTLNTRSISDISACIMHRAAARVTKRLNPSALIVHCVTTSTFINNCAGPVFT